MFYKIFNLRDTSWLLQIFEALLFLKLCPLFVSELPENIYISVATNLGGHVCTSLIWIICLSSKSWMESSLYDQVEGAGVEIHESDPSFREHQNDALWNRRAFANRKSELDLPDELNRRTDKIDRWTSSWKTVGKTNLHAPPHDLLSSSQLVFTNFPSTNLRIFSPIFLSWKRNSLLVKKKAFGLNFDHFRKT